MIKRGSVVQERFYNAIEQIYQGMYQSIATCGKRLYCMNERKLIFTVGDSSDVLKLSKEMIMEDFRVTIRRVNDSATERKQVDMMIFNLVTAGFLDKISASNLLGRASEQDMWEAVREYSKQMVEVEAMQQQQMQQQQQMAMMQQQAMQEQQVQGQQQQAQQQSVERDKDRQIVLEKELLKQGLKK
jgi:hypothetical protein